MANNKLAIIGGSGLYDVEEFKERELIKLNTPWGKPSDDILKIKYNNVIGYFFEVTQLQKRKFIEIKDSERFIPRQSLKGAARFVTEELSDLSEAINNAAKKAIDIEIATTGCIGTGRYFRKSIQEYQPVGCTHEHDSHPQEEKDSNIP